MAEQAAGATQSRAAIASTDVVVYGATPAGIAAALAAADDGRSVVLIEPTSRIGGLVTSGLSHTDFHSLEGLSGSFLAFSRRVEAHYAEKYGPDSQQVRESYHGTFGEPKVNLLVFEQLLAERPKIELRASCRLVSVQTSGSGEQPRDTAPAPPARNEPHRLNAVTVRDIDGNMSTLQAKMFIDGTYEGDLLAAAGIPWHAGREGRDQYGESLAPEVGDSQIQAYNFRFIMTTDPQNRVTPIAPPGYHRDAFLPVLQILESGQIKKVFDYPSRCIFKAHLPILPNGKYDINDVSRGVVRLSLPGVNAEWPDGDEATRARIFTEQLRDQVGLLYFLQNDEAVPAHFRKEARQWGWCRDEFTETGHLPPQIYVREARRMIGRHVFIQADSEHAPNDARAVLHDDAIAMGDYGNNCHGTAHEGPRFGGRHTGEFYNPVPPYQIPYGVLIPRKTKNLLVAGAVSSSHVGFCALRLEPIWMSMGQAAGHAAAQAIAKSCPVQQVNVARLQHRLHAAGSATIYVSDVLPGSPDFAAVQWWGLQGGLHGLEPMPAKPGQRGKKLQSQYTEAAPGHAAKLDQPLDASTHARWLAITDHLELPREVLPGFEAKSSNAVRGQAISERAVTRGDFIRAAFHANGN